MQFVEKRYKKIIFFCELDPAVKQLEPGGPNNEPAMQQKSWHPTVRAGHDSKPFLQRGHHALVCQSTRLKLSDNQMGIDNAGGSFKAADGPIVIG